MASDEPHPEGACAAPSHEAPSSPAPDGDRPVAVLVLGALAVALGLVGLLGVFMGCFGTGWTLLAPAGGLPGTGLPAEQAQAQQEMMAITRRLLPVTIGMLVATLPLAGLLLYGGGLVLADRASGVRYLRWAFVYGLVLESLRYLVGIGVQWATWRKSWAMFQSIFEQPSGAVLPPEVHAMFSASMIVVVVAGLVMGLLWLAIKIGLYAAGLWILRSDDTRAWVEPPM